jgi:hypothetical protein
LTSSIHHKEIFEKIRHFIPFQHVKIVIKVIIKKRKKTPKLVGGKRQFNIEKL